jgi:hypothetical protein
MRHNWNAQDDERLLATVDSLDGVLPPTVRWWSAVAGALAQQGLVVSADAARSRHERLARQRAEDAAAMGNAGAEKAWRDTIAKVESYEADWQDHTIEALKGIRDSISALDTRLAAIEQEQIRMRRLWE